MAGDAKSCFSSKVEYRAVIRDLYLKGKTGKEIHSELTEVYGSSAPSYAKVKFWVGEFKRGRTSLEDEARSGRLLDATDEEMCKKVRDLVHSGKLIQVEEIAQALGISHGSISTILHDRLGMPKLTVRWAPKSLSDEQMATRASVCSALLKHFRSKDDFLLHLVTEDETWVHYNKPKLRSSVGRAWVPETKEVQGATIYWQGDGHSILGRKRRYNVGLFTQEKYNKWSVLCKLVAAKLLRHGYRYFKLRKAFSKFYRRHSALLEQELRQAGHYTPVASNKMQHINWLLYNSVLRI